MKIINLKLAPLPSLYKAAGVVDLPTEDAKRLKDASSFYVVTGEEPMERAEIIADIAIRNGLGTIADSVLIGDQYWLAMPIYEAMKKGGIMACVIGCMSRSWWRRRKKKYEQGE